MPLHDWTRVEAGIFHAFHTTWIAEIQNELNRQLPGRYYALAEQHAGSFVADVLTLQSPTLSDGGADPDESSAPVSPAVDDAVGTTIANQIPNVAVQEKIDVEIRDRHRTLTIRHVSNHRIIALLEIVSPANKDREQHINELSSKTLTPFNAEFMF